MPCEIRHHVTPHWLSTRFEYVDGHTHGYSVVSGGVPKPAWFDLWGTVRVEGGTREVLAVELGEVQIGDLKAYARRYGVRIRASPYATQVGEHIRLTFTPSGFDHESARQARQRPRTHPRAPLTVGDWNPPVGNDWITIADGVADSDGTLRLDPDWAAKNVLVRERYRTLNAEIPGQGGESKVLSDASKNGVVGADRTKVRCENLQAPHVPTGRREGASKPQKGAAS